MNLTSSLGTSLLAFGLGQLLGGGDIINLISFVHSMSNPD